MNRVSNNCVYFFASRTNIVTGAYLTLTTSISLFSLTDLIPFHLSWLPIYNSVNYLIDERLFHIIFESLNDTAGIW